jgi:hypothetical protein
MGLLSSWNQDQLLVSPMLQEAPKPTEVSLHPLGECTALGNYRTGRGV